MPVRLGPIRSSRHRRLPLALAVALFVGALTACSGGDGPAATATTSAAAPTDRAAGSPTGAPAPEETGGALTVTGVDFDFELEATELTAGKYEIEFVNDGGASHDVRVERDGEDVSKSEVIPPGGTSSFSVTLEPGEYVFYCSVGNHRDMGMEVTVTVT